MIPFRPFGLIISAGFSAVTGGATAAAFHLTSTQIGAVGVIGAIVVPIALELLHRSKGHDEDRAVQFLIREHKAMEKERESMERRERSWDKAIAERDAYITELEARRDKP